MNTQLYNQRRKSATDILLIKEVQKATEVAMQAVISYVQETTAPTAEAAHRLIDEVLQRYDCESPKGHIVAGGKASAEPHEIGTGLLPEGAPIVIDIYPRSRHSGYFADMTRTVCLGVPSEALGKMYDTVLAAQTLAISMVRPGVRCADIQQAVEEVFIQAGYETSGRGKEFQYAEGFVHSIGHGVGQEVHELPKFSKTADDVLEVGDVVTIEPGLYYHDIGGVRIEDLLWVMPDGAENLTNFPKNFRI
jgi:Xaa-Pro aminopeptidase